MNQLDHIITSPEFFRQPFIRLPESITGTVP